MTMMVSVTLGSLPNSLMCIICTTALQAGSSYEKGEGRRTSVGWGDGLASRSVLHTRAKTRAWSPASTVKAKCGGGTHL